MNKIILTCVLLSPILVAGSLWFMIPKDPKGTAARLNKITGTKASTAGVMAANVPAQGASTTATPAAPPADQKKMLRPEFLPQGYILVVKDLTGLASPSSPIHLASSYNGWNPGDKKSVLTGRSDLRWQIVMPPAASDAGIAFKFTRGSWDLEELDAELKGIANRSLPEVDAAKYGDGKTQPIFEFEIPKWGDQRPNAALRPDVNPYFYLQNNTNIRRLEVAGGDFTPYKRDLLVWLPPGYDAPENKDERYPVLYLHDAQNLFQQHPAIPAEWGADEAATKLIAEGKIEPMIIVGVPHMGAGRTSEYLPNAFAGTIKDVTPMGDRYVQWLATQAVPRVNRAFRTLAGPEHTTVGGASLGALIAMEAAVQRPDVFGGVLLESMSMLTGDAAPLAHFGKAQKWPTRVYFAMGGKEGGANPADATLNARYQAAANAFNSLAAGKVAKDKLFFVLDPEATHSETAWAKRFPVALEYLYRKPAKAN